jgi:hypothetical protein
MTGRRAAWADRMIEGGLDARAPRTARNAATGMTMEPTPELIDDIFRERVLRARGTPEEVKLLDGPRLFDTVCQRMKDGIRMQFPNAGEEEVRKILQQRLAIARMLEENP